MTEPAMPAACRAANKAIEMRVGLAEIISHGATCESPRPSIRLVDESDTGFGIEGDKADWGHVAVGDIVGIHLKDGEPPVLGAVALNISSTPGKVRIGVHRLTSSARAVEVMPVEGRGQAHGSLIFVPGQERGGTQDGLLVSEAAFAKGGWIEVAAESLHFTLRLDRALRRGRGWVLAGFEVTGISAEPRADAA